MRAPRLPPDPVLRRLAVASLANSAGALLGADYAFDLVRPGLALYGGGPAPGGPAPDGPVPAP